jgi:hypothetical protein
MLSVIFSKENTNNNIAGATLNPEMMAALEAAQNLDRVEKKIAAALETSKKAAAETAALQKRAEVLNKDTSVPANIKKQAGDAANSAVTTALAIQQTQTLANQLHARAKYAIANKGATSKEIAETTALLEKEVAAIAKTAQTAMKAIEDSMSNLAEAEGLANSYRVESAAIMKSIQEKAEKIDNVFKNATQYISKITKTTDQISHLGQVAPRLVTQAQMALDDAEGLTETILDTKKQMTPLLAQADQLMRETSNDRVAQLKLISEMMDGLQKAINATFLAIYEHERTIDRLNDQRRSTPEIIRYELQQIRGSEEYILISKQIDVVIANEGEESDEELSQAYFALIASIKEFVSSHSHILQFDLEFRLRLAKLELRLTQNYEQFSKEREIKKKVMGANYRHEAYLDKYATEIRTIRVYVDHGSFWDGCLNLIYTRDECYEHHRECEALAQATQEKKYRKNLQ